MPESAPLEIICAPLTVYIAPVGEAFPDVDEVPAGNWLKLGTSGDKNITEEGLTVQHPQALEYFRMFGSTGPRKVTRTEEDFILSFMLADLTLEQYAHILNTKTVTDTPAASGTPGYREISLHRGRTVTQRALLVRGASPYLDDGNSQYQVPIVVHSGSPEVVYAKDAPAALLFEFTALEDPNDDDYPFGKLLAQDADALP